jgi:hypothetical protein
MLNFITDEGSKKTIELLDKGICQSFHEFNHHDLTKNHNNAICWC